jgi:transcriptional regulator with XRE-family HTH domain
MKHVHDELAQFAINARKIRKAKGYTYEQAAEMTGMDASGIVKFEARKTKRPSAYMLLAMANAYSVTIEQLLGRNEHAK